MGINGRNPLGELVGNYCWKLVANPRYQPKKLRTSCVRN